MFPEYSTFKTHHPLSNHYATLGNTTKLLIEGIFTVIYTLNGQTILTRNTLYISALWDPLYSLFKQRQQPGCVVSSSYKDGSYLFFPNFSLQVGDSYDNIVSYRALIWSHQYPIDYITPKSTRSTSKATPSRRTWTITPFQNPPSPHNIP